MGMMANNLMFQSWPRHDRLSGFLASAFSQCFVALFERWIHEICLDFVKGEIGRQLRRYPHDRSEDQQIEAGEMFGELAASAVVGLQFYKSQDRWCG